MTRQLCACCREAEFVDGVGWINEHAYMCANEEHGWAFTVETDEVGHPVLYPPGAIDER